MTDDMLQWANSAASPIVAQGSPIGVGARGADLLGEAQVRSPVPVAQRPVRHRPNNGRKKRTNRSPLAEPPWDLLRETGYPIPPDVKNLPYTPTNWRRGAEWIRWRAGVHAMWGYVCHLCHHPQAHTADHLVPLSVWSNQPYDPRLSRPAHGIEGCPTCNVKCNSSRGNRQLAIEIGQYRPPIML